MYHTAEPAPDQRGFEVRRPDPPLLLEGEYEGDEYDPELL
ncbi:hypothetical protein SAMCFNEI73_pB0021 (plasmid) [Sinorhizobium americanum]|uniref:Uncharacterized protein n=1 Tax=Sinorhizobium americanum TaxID=194963 RepID=A0A1L3LT05_9HYPH|nr:hypothetical protein SAMCFNEI73_pB0021 [Sinorhizobium americanum]